MPSNIGSVQIPYEKGKKHVLDADVLLYEGLGPLSAPAIQIASKSPFAHVGLAGWTNGSTKYAELMAYEMLLAGGQSTTVKSHVEKRKRVHVYRVSDTHTTYSFDKKRGKVVPKTHVLDRKQAVYLMKQFCRPGEYGKMHLLWTAFLHLPVIRLFFRQPTDDELADRSRPPYCSEAVSYALRKAFSDVVKNTPDHYTSPGALARSPLLHYMFTLVP